MKHIFTDKIEEILATYFDKRAEQVFVSSQLIQYINQKTVSAQKGSKARGSFGNLYAIYVLIEDYVNKEYNNFIRTCEQLKTIENDKNKKETTDIKSFILELIEPNIDARLFEIVSYALLKVSYSEQTVFFGFTRSSIKEESLKLYKTGRTNANDGGIDFVMKPLGRFFQVTETTDVKKYFLDIDKIEKFPITFVIKSTEKVEDLKYKIKKVAEQQYGVEAIVNKYITCIEEIINLPKLQEILNEIEKKGKINEVLTEIIRYSKLEFNYEEMEELE